MAYFPAGSRCRAFMDAFAKSEPASIFSALNWGEIQSKIYFFSGKTQSLVVILFIFSSFLTSKVITSVSASYVVCPWQVDLTNQPTAPLPWWWRRPHWRRDLAWHRRALIRIHSSLLDCHLIWKTWLNRWKWVSRHSYPFKVSRHSCPFKGLFCILPLFVMITFFQEEINPTTLFFEVWSVKPPIFTNFFKFSSNWICQ